MDCTEAIAWVLAVSAGTLRLSQLRTLSESVAATLRVERISSSNDPKQCSVFTVGRIMRQEMNVSRAEAFGAVVLATVKAAPAWC